MKLVRQSLVFVLACLALVTCSSDPAGPANGAVESIVVSPANPTVALGASVGLNAQVMDVNGAFIDRSVHWASEDETIATVSEFGVVTARKLGTVQVAASTSGRSGFAQITVTTIPVATLQIVPGNKALLVEESFQFNAQVRDISGRLLTDRPVTWSSNNEGVATVSATGLVTALSPGGAIITATSEGKSAPSSVTVSAIPVASVRVTPTTLSLVDGQTAQLQAEPLDAQGEPLVGRVILWSTSSAAVATVTSTGQVTANVPGTVTITATCEGQRGTVVVTVNPPSPNVVVVTPAQVLVQQGATAQLSAQVLDTLGRVIPNSPVTFTSSNAAVAAISPTGLLTGVSQGGATISATSGGKTGTAQVTVTHVPVASVAVTPNAPTIQVGKTVALTAEALSGSGQLLSGRTVAWSSGTPSVAQVAATGVVTGMSSGTAVVFASIDGVLGWANVTVVQVPVASVTITPATPTVAVGQTTQLTAVTQDAAGTILQGRVVSWSTSAAAIADVNNAGIVTGVTTGTATITATSEGQTGTATVTVSPGVRTLTVTPDTATLAPLGTIQLTAVVRDASGAIITPGINWSTSNSAVAKVSNSGKVTALVPGVAIITARTGSGSNLATGTATITVQ